MNGAQLARSVVRIPPTLARCRWRASRSPGRRCPVDGASTLPAPASRRFPAVVPCSETTLSWCCPRATRAMEIHSLGRDARRSRHGRLLSRNAARTVVGPLAERPPRCVGRKGVLGPALPCARFAGKSRRRLSQTGEWRCSLQDSAAHIPPARGHIMHPRSKLLQQVTIPTNSLNTPNKAKTGQIGQKWQSAQNSPKIGQAPRKPQNHTTTTSPWG